MTAYDASKRKWVLALASIASLMVALDTLVVSTALTTIRADLGASIEQLEWTVNAYNLTLAVLAHAGSGARRSLRAAAHVRGGNGAFRSGLGSLRAVPRTWTG